VDNQANWNLARRREYLPKSHHDDVNKDQDLWSKKSLAQEESLKSAGSLLGAFLTVTVPSDMPK
jgi:hypothetical protein